MHVHGKLALFRRTWVILAVGVAVHLPFSDAAGCSAAIQGIWSGTLAASPNSAGTDAIWRLSETLLTLKANNKDFTQQCTAEFTLSCVVGTALNPSCQTAPTGEDVSESGFFSFTPKKFSGQCSQFTTNKLWADTTVQLDYALIERPNPKDSRLFISGTLGQASSGPCATYKFDRGLPRKYNGPEEVFQIASASSLGGILLVGWIALFCAVPKCKDPDYGDDAPAPPSAPTGRDFEAGAGAGLADDKSDASSVATLATNVSSVAKAVRCGGCMTKLSSTHHTICPICSRRLAEVGFVDEQYKPVRVRRNVRNTSGSSMQYQQQQFHPQQHPGYGPPGQPGYGAAWHAGPGAPPPPAGYPGPHGAP